MKRLLFISLCLSIVIAGCGSNPLGGEAGTLQLAYDNAGAGGGYDKQVVLDAGQIYTGRLTVSSGDVYIEGNGAIIQLDQFSTISAVGSGTSLTIKNCAIVGASFGLCVDQDAQVTVDHNVFYNNREAIHFYDTYEASVVSNNIFAGGDYGVRHDENTPVSILDNVAWDNRVANYMEYCEG